MELYIDKQVNASEDSMLSDEPTDALINESILFGKEMCCHSVDRSFKVVSGQFNRTVEERAANLHLQREITAYWHNS